MTMEPRDVSYPNGGKYLHKATKLIDDGAPLGSVASITPQYCDVCRKLAEAPRQATAIGYGADADNPISIYLCGDCHKLQYINPALFFQRVREAQDRLSNG